MAGSSDSSTHIVGKVRKFLEAGEQSQVNQAAIAEAKDRLGSILSDLSSEFTKRDPSNLKLYPSESGKCGRQVQYKALGIPAEPMTGDVQWKLAMGRMVEMALLYVMQATPGVTVIDNNKKMEVRIGRHKWRGASDGVLVSPNGERRNLEVKSASGIGFKMTLKNGIDDNFGYLTQASVYVRQMMADKTINVPETVFVYIDRDSMKMAEFVMPYDDRLAKAADEKFDNIVLGVQAKKMVPRGFELGPDGSLGLQCSYCPVKHTCWTEPVQAVSFEGGHPVYRVPPTRRIELVMMRNKPKWFVT